MVTDRFWFECHCALSDNEDSCIVAGTKTQQVDTSLIMMAKLAIKVDVHKMKNKF